MVDISQNIWSKIAWNVFTKPNYCSTLVVKSQVTWTFLGRSISTKTVFWGFSKLVIKSRKCCDIEIHKILPDTRAKFQIISGSATHPASVSILNLLDTSFCDNHLIPAEIQKVLPSPEIPKVLPSPEIQVIWITSEAHMANNYTEYLYSAWTNFLFFSFWWC